MYDPDGVEELGRAICRYKPVTFSGSKTFWSELQIPPSEGFNGCWWIIFYEHYTPTVLQNLAVTPTFRSGEAMKYDKTGFSPDNFGGIETAKQKSQPQRG